VAAKVSSELCTGCGSCVEVCPADAIVIRDGNAQVKDEACVEYGLCVGECPAGAIQLG
jgi:NAD-dependent dihydropyrimidine dehydrogenase PreA subunit